MSELNSIPFLDLRAQYQGIQSEVEEAVLSVLQSQQFVMGPAVHECEERLADYCDCRHAIGVSSGSDALLICLMAEEIGPGDEVITTPYTFFATAGAIARVGATPVFVDICPRTYNLDVRQIKEKVNYRTKAIIPVHLFGQCAEMDTVMKIARLHSLIVIEDAAQAIGAEHRRYRAGSLGHYGCFSFFPSKTLGAAGDGGMVVTQDEMRAQKLRSLRSHGAQPKHFHSLVGGNFRLDAIQAAIVNVKLTHLDSWIAGRQANAKRYGELFHQADAVQPNRVQLPWQVEDDRHTFNQFVIRVPQRDRLRVHLQQRAIDTQVYYPLPLHLQKCFAGLGYQNGDFLAAEQAARETLALPIFPELRPAQLRRVVESVCDFLK